MLHGRPHRSSTTARVAQHKRGSGEALHTLEGQLGRGPAWADAWTTTIITDEELGAPTAAQASTSSVVSPDGKLRRPSGPREPSPEGGGSSKLLTALIKSASSWQALHQLVRTHGESFNFLHVSACMSHLAQLKAGATAAAAARFSAASPCMLNPAAGAQLQSTSEAAWPMCGPHDAPSEAHAPPHLPAGVPPAVRPSCSREYMDLMDVLLRMAEAASPQFGARQATNTLWALAQLSPHPGCARLMASMLPQLQPLLPWCEPQHLANSLWAVVRAGLSPDDAWLEDFLDASEAAMPNFQPQHLGNVVWALARLGIAPDDAWTGVFLAQLSAVGWDALCMGAHTQPYQTLVLGT